MLDVFKFKAFLFLDDNLPLIGVLKNFGTGDV